MKRLLIACCLLIATMGCSPAMGCNTLLSSEPCTRVLFVGNSYTFVNDLPTMFANLAGSGGHPVETGMAAQGGWTLANHITAEDTTNALNSSKWNYVVLQEQSEIPSVEQSRTQTMYPAARVLVRSIRDAGAKPIFFETWAHSDGLPANGMPTYESMQYQIDSGYWGIAQEA